MAKSFSKAFKVFFVLSFLFLQAFTASARENNIESLRFRETEIRTVIRSIAVQAYRDGRKVNIVTGPEVIGLVTIELEDVGWQDALRIVLRAHGYGYEWVGDYMLLVGTSEEIAERRRKDAASREIEATTTEVFRFNFAKVDDLRPVVQELISARGRVTIDRRTNTMILSDTPSSLESIRENIRSLDEITPQVLIEAKIVETTFDAKANLGVNWDLAIKAESQAGPLGWSSIPDAFTLGTLDASDVGAALDLILQDDEAKVLSQPKILTMDNSPASIRVVTEEPIPSYNFNADTGMWEISGFDYKGYGVVLEVTPQINSDGYITLKIEPEVSDFLQDKVFSSAGQTVNIPIIETRTASTQVMIRDNETLVIGGLIKDKKDHKIRKIPILGDIPVLGWLFKNRAVDDRKVNLLVFITPRIMTPQIEEETIDVGKAEEVKE